MKLSHILPYAKTPSALFLILVNLVPIMGVFLFDWDVGTLLLLYWVESIVIGLLNIPKMLTAKGDTGKVGIGHRLFLIIFFCVHFGLFCFGHYSFLSGFFETIPPLTELLSQIMSLQGVLISALGLLVSHALSMFLNFYGKGEYLTRAVGAQMFLPYGRIFIMHFVIIFGGILVEAFGAPIFALLLLVGLKIIVDLASHAAEHHLTNKTA